MFSKHSLLFGKGIACLLFAFIVACNPAVKPKQKSLGFYYWNTIFRSSSLQQLYLKETQADLLYIRLFDIDTVSSPNGLEAIPISTLRVQDSLPKNLDIVPVVYFTRQGIKSIKNIDTFSTKVSTLVKKLSDAYGFSFSEIQWDYDWTPSTKQTYFELLESLKCQPELIDKTFSVTIRLHQVKHRSVTGIPPADKGLLMCYNMGNLKSYNIENSILSLKDMKDYLRTLDSYPLKMDIALPLFSWALHFRDKKFVRILRDCDTLIAHPNLASTSESNYKVISEFKFGGYSFLTNDEIRFESVSTSALQNSVDFLREKNNNDSVSILLFNLDDQIISNHPSYEVKSLFDSY